MKMHVHGLGLLWLHFIIDDTIRHGIVGLNWHGRLLVAHLFKNDENLDNFTCHVVEGSKFSLRGRQHDMFYYLCNVENSTIVAWDLFIK